MISLNKNINSNKTKHLLVENELKKFDSTYLRGKSYFASDDTTQNTINNKSILEWKSEGLSD